MTNWFKLHVRDSGLPRIRLHDLRHSAAVAMLEAGVPVKVVSESLGHAGINITMDIYAHVLPETDARAADMLASVIDG